MATLDIPTKPQKTTAKPETSLHAKTTVDTEAQQKTAVAQNRSTETLDIPTKPRQINTVINNSVAVPQKRLTETLDIPTTPRKRAAVPRKNTADVRQSSTLAEKHITAKKLHAAVPKVKSAASQRRPAGSLDIPTKPHRRKAISSQILAEQMKAPGLSQTGKAVVHPRTTGIPKYTGIFGKELAGFTGNLQQEESRRSWRILPFALLVMWTACLTLFLALVIRVTIPLSVKVSLNSILRSDYSTDPLGGYFPSLDMGIILDVLHGQDSKNAPSAYATLLSQRLTPVATVTPNGTTTPWLMPSPTSGVTLTPTPAPSLTLYPTSTPSPTLTPSPMFSGTPIAGTLIPTFTLTLYPGDGKTATPRSSRTPIPRVSPTRTFQPNDTNTAQPETPTSPPAPTATRTRPPNPTTRPTNTRDPYPYP